jgi:hypothetical protein
VTDGTGVGNNTPVTGIEGEASRSAEGSPSPRDDDTA